MAKGPDSPGTPETIDDASRRASLEPAPVPAPPVFTLEVVATSHYELEGEQGRGGLGRVLRAYDRRLDRVVAVKELLRPDARARERFLREVRITAKLQHPGIVPVHEAGQWPSGEPFYAMKLVEGQTLRERLEKTQGLADRLALLPNLIVVADAMAYAHSKDVIHRDLKPSNIVVGRFGETVVIDWGLAKILSHADDDSSPASGSPESGEQTQLGEVIGTPSYMAPEQAAGAVVDKRTDVYALGSILYHLIAGRAPFDISGRRVADEPPPDLRDLAPETPRDLLAIVAKAMEPELPHRYQDAAAFAEDLRRFQNGQLVSVRQYTARELVARWIRRHRAVVAIGSIAAAALLVVSVVAFLRIVASERVARQGQRAAEEQRNELILSNARAALATDPTLAAAWVKRYPRDGSDRAGLEQVIADAQSLGVARHVIPVHGMPNQLAFSVDSQLLVAALGGTPIRAWNVRTGAAQKALGDLLSDEFHIALRANSMAAVRNESSAAVTSLYGEPRALSCGSRVGGVAIAPDGKTVACASLQDGSLLILDLNDTLLGRFSLPTILRDSLQSVTISTTGRYVFLSASNGGLARVDLLTGRIHHSLLPRGVSAQAAAASDSTLLVGDADNVLWRWDPDLPVLTSLSPKATALGWSARGQLVAVARPDGAVVVMSDDGREVRRHEGHLNVTALALSDDGQFLAAGYRNGTIARWDESQGGEVIYRGHSAQILELALSPNGEWLASVGFDLRIRLWSRPHLPVRSIVTSRPNRIRFTETPYEASLDGRYLAGTFPGGVMLWNLETGDVVRSLELVGDPETHRLFFSLDGALLIAVGRLGVYGIEIPSGRILWRELVASSIEHASMNKERTELVAATSSGSILYVELGATIARVELGGHEAPVWRVSSIDEASRVASVDIAGRVLLWDLVGGSNVPLGTVSERGRFVELVGDVVMAGGISTVHAWRIDGSPMGSWRVPEILGWFRTEVAPLGGPRALFADAQGTVRVWSPGSGSAVLRIGGGFPTMVERFAPRTIASLSTDGVVAFTRGETKAEPEYRVRISGGARSFVMFPHLGLFGVESYRGVLSFYSYFDPFRRDGLDPWQRAEALTTFVDVGSN